MNEQSIFIAALEQPPVERAGFLDRVCEQIPELRQRVEKLLQFHEAADGFMEPSDAVFAQTLIQPPLEREGTRIGTYVLREQLGEGGMGIVYVAEQREPVRRLVALKVVKPGMDTREVLARFEAERQALAVMNHPHIAKILDGGATETGRPYFVMELVKGIAITEYCDQHKLSVRQRLELFILVCEAVQHAHQKGVIHRDLKPSNVLVELHDVTPVPKVIDFGIAKATNQQLSQHTIYTQFAQLVGTPLYMSPEQAQLSGLDVDTRSDIYSLGVMLYELLTGSTPFDSTTLTKAGLEEMRRIIREDEPLRPSQKVSTLHAELLSTVSTRRQADARKLSVSMRRELDWIVMRAMEKDRQRRYDSASALAGDIRRYLNDEPVQACPPSTAYRLQKFARRHRAMLTTATVVSTAILVGAVLSLWQAVEATNARKLADKRLASEQQARGEAEDERNRADTERERAEASFAKALEAVDRMLTRVGAESLQDIPQMEVIQKQILQDAVEFYEGFLVQRGSDPKVRSEAASIYVRIGQIYFKFDQTAECNQAFHRANSLYIALHAEQPDDVPIRQALALSHAHLGWAAVNLQEREHHHRRTIELLTPIAERPDVVGSLANSYRSLADVLNSLNRLDESEQQFKKAIALCQEHPGWDENVLPSTYSGLALLLERTGRIAPATQGANRRRQSNNGLLQD